MFLFCKLILICAVILPFCQINSAANVTQSDVSLMVNSSFGFLDDDCYFLLESFANASAKFTYCVIRSARPIMICQDCVESYVLSVEVHKDILKLLDRAGELCKQKLLNLDRLQIVEGGFGYIYNLWKRAKCDACYEMESKDHPEVLKKEILEILSLKNETDTCINYYRNKTEDGRRVTDPKVCYECKEQYLKLNAYYNSLEVASPMCMDIIDMMNTTRKVWSVDIGCCLDRKNPEYFFLVSSGIISVLPVLFYLLACSFAGKKEHQVVLLRNRCSIPYTGYVPMPVPAAKTEDLPASSTSSTSAQINDNI